MGAVCSRCSRRGDQGNPMASHHPRLSSGINIMYRHGTIDCKESNCTLTRLCCFSCSKPRLQKNYRLVFAFFRHNFDLGIVFFCATQCCTYGVCNTSSVDAGILSTPITHRMTPLSVLSKQQLHQYAQETPFRRDEIQRIHSLFSHLDKQHQGKLGAKVLSR